MLAPRPMEDDEGESQEMSRIHLTLLDFILDELEDLNVKGRTRISVRVSSDLKRMGVDQPNRWSITELIDRVFELQEPVLRRLRERRRPRPRRV
jgi:hypothetical protein